MTTIFLNSQKKRQIKKLKKINSKLLIGLLAYYTQFKNFHIMPIMK